MPYKCFPRDQGNVQDRDDKSTIEDKRDNGK